MLVELKIGKCVRLSGTKEEIVEELDNLKKNDKISSVIGMSEDVALNLVCIWYFRR